jgi:hypothetical protein
MTQQSDPSDVAEQIGTDPQVDVTEDASGKESYHGYSVDDESQPQSSGDSLVDNRGLAEPLDEGYSPPEKYSAGQGYGNTPLEEELGETLDQRVVQEIPEPDPYEVAAREVDETAGEVGNERTGRLVAEGDGDAVPDDNLLADDVGIDGAGAAAEEAAMHTIDEEETP